MLDRMGDSPDIKPFWVCSLTSLRIGGEVGATHSLMMDAQTGRLPFLLYHRIFNDPGFGSL